MISRKQAELVASQAVVENLRERENSLTAENKKFKVRLQAVLWLLMIARRRNLTLLE